MFSVLVPIVGLLTFEEEKSSLICRVEKRKRTLKKIRKLYRSTIKLSYPACLQLKSSQAEQQLECLVTLLVRFK